MSGRTNMEENRDSLSLTEYTLEERSGILGLSAAIILPIWEVSRRGSEYKLEAVGDVPVRVGTDDTL